MALEGDSFVPPSPREASHGECHGVIAPPGAAGMEDLKWVLGEAGCWEHGPDYRVRNRVISGGSGPRGIAGSARSGAHTTDRLSTSSVSGTIRATQLRETSLIG